MTSETTATWPGALEFFSEILTSARKRKWIVILIPVVCVALSGIEALVVRPTYRAVVLAAPTRIDPFTGGASGSSGLGGLDAVAAVAGINLGSGGNGADEALAVLRSQELARSFVLGHDLVKKFYSSAWGPDGKLRRRWFAREPTIGMACKLFDEKIRMVTQDKKTGLVSIAITWRDRLEAAQWANELVLRTNALMRRRATEESNAALEYLRNELQATQEVEIRAAVSRLIELQIRRRMLASVMPEYSFRVIDAAVAPDPFDVYWPTKRILLLVGAALGLGLDFLMLLYFVMKNRLTGSSFH
jgi:hypothetical protein